MDIPMPKIYLVIVVFSLAGTVFMSVLSFTRSRNLKLLSLNLFIILLAAACVWRLFGRSQPVSKGEEDLGYVVALYICMLLGMFSSFVFQRFQKSKKKRPAFDWSSFLSPIFVSPLVFIPLLGALQNANIDLANLDAARLMVFFVAFENGFLWKEFFEKRTKQKRDKND
ncbi:hypothetical protein [Sulfidibacter corallicola]|uniref:Uncharacterized protein n=1 Tax=Sulfidibacter corallicola TaxID=2818388 RepID=A0A8A4TMM0_SULCO|nr:hypothetical protein [Sulfidibacter corallicola]QTD50707.1 hypothetical protein J3U87_34405 [Sulfidibacter corallicola]